VTPAQEIIRLFAKIAASLAGYTDRVVISFADLYHKTQAGLRRLPGLTFQDILQSPDELLALAQALSRIALLHDMRIETCAEGGDLSDQGIQHGACIDARLLHQLFGLAVSVRKDRGQRPECLCAPSVDIGAYHCCLHGCVYCYATANRTQALKNHQSHDPDSPFLLGPAPASILDGSSGCGRSQLLI
jgi:hypothetical protein